jgi:tripartite-type tricarboxylate transporter receptor subunit TctC
MAVSTAPAVRRAVPEIASKRGHKYMQVNLNSTRRKFISTAGALGLVAASGLVYAAFPDRPIHIILSLPPGTTTDAVARAFGPPLSARLGQPIVVDNKIGANGVIAARFAARAAPDGYTMFIGSNTTHAANASMVKNLGYDPVNDFEPITRIGLASLVLGVSNSVPVSNVRELIAYAKANPGKLSFGSGTSSARIAGEMLRAKAGIDILNVPYTSNAQALTDLLGGQIQILLGDVALMLPQVRAGAVKGLAISSARRSSLLPDMPTMQEAGVAGYEFVTFIAMFAPAKTPEPIIKRWNEELVGVLGNKEFASRLVELGFDPAPTSPEQLRSFVNTEIVKWRDLVKGAGIQPE